MSTQAAASAPSAAAAPESASVTKGELFWKFVALGLITAVMGAECLLAFIYIPMADKATPGAEKASPASRIAKEAELREEDDRLLVGFERRRSEPVLEREIDLGEYSVSAYLSASNSTLLINFHVYGTLAAEDQLAFADHFEVNEHRIRDQVIHTVRSAEFAELTDPGLDLIKRQILQKANRALGKALLRQIVFSEFLVAEQ